jgi:hypothetical protein
MTADLLAVTILSWQGARIAKMLWLGAKPQKAALGCPILR